MSFFVKSSLKPLYAFAVLTIDSIKTNTAAAQEYSENACVVVAQLLNLILCFLPF